MKITHEPTKREVIILFSEMEDGEKGIINQWAYPEHPSKGCKCWRIGDLYHTQHQHTLTTHKLGPIHSPNLTVIVRR